MYPRHYYIEHAKQDAKKMALSGWKVLEITENLDPNIPLQIRLAISRNALKRVSGKG